MLHWSNLSGTRLSLITKCTKLDKSMWYTGFEFLSFFQSIPSRWRHQSKLCYGEKRTFLFCWYNLYWLYLNLCSTSGIFCVGKWIIKVFCSSEIERTLEAHDAKKIYVGVCNFIKCEKSWLMTFSRLPVSFQRCCAQKKKTTLWGSHYTQKKHW